MSESSNTDVIIVGAGPAGLALACALADAGIRSHVLEQNPADDLVQPPEDGRDIAMTHRARRIMTQLGLWARLPADEIAPLYRAQVTNGESPRHLMFDGNEDGHEQLGWLVPNHRIREACYAGAMARGEMITLSGDARVTALARNDREATVSLADGRRFSAPLVVAADSRFSSVRRMAGIGARSLDFGRTAIVCRMAHDIAHDGTAHECFLHGHTLAMLPMSGKQSSAVWTITSDKAGDLMAMSDADFTAAVSEAFGHRLGRMQQAGSRHAYPLVAVYAQRFWSTRFVLVGDSAVGMHPVTAHGYNFGLYGVEVLARELAAARQAGRDLGDSRALAAYAREHERTTLPIYLGTNIVVKLFTDDRQPARLLREAVVGLTNLLPPIRAAVTRQLTGDGRPSLRQLLPRLPFLPRQP
ncbi:ubiquinone biosynthesis UbiH/UbiF/VisC/COQ6 family hydroxylase [Azonexus fungiphilus]|uniref:Ubiquinone biosynthesis UbiH/UbiF/VisC/COQ6 family hydroxylase n=1 Tax=Azonexus fungiphilus TaxID=146940 RepID=A0A495WGH3_9RHOO|nr:5-demethoxyubiquinol-8 5-hydroxylase UbiM [Azonexus fungiphilus]RKT60449.1 ubiquinone biosynthesis UbiH/UbiF/VisC/COQ6 family hydroxylase [Azonexus fungiphilus]